MRTPWLVAALTVGALAVPSAQAAPDPCTGWSTTVLASGLGSLENLEPDTRGGLYLSASDHDAVQRFTRDGRVVDVAAASSPGGLRLRGSTLLFTTGDAAASGALGTPDGTIEQLDVRTGRRSTYATGLTMPNGLVLLPDGSALTSRDVAGLRPTGITRVARRAAAPQVRWSDQADSNGMAVDPTGRWLYTDETFTAASNVYRIEIAHPERREVVASLAGLGVPKGLDDLTISTSGVLYLAANAAGEVIRLDPATGRSCVVVSGLRTTSAVKQGRSGAFPSGRLYATGFDGRLLELTPPRGVTP